MIRHVFLLAAALMLLGSTAVAQTIVFHEPGFPAADSPAPQREQLSAMFPGARLVAAADLDAAVGTARLLVLPYGSAFPEEAWPAILQHLERGGNLIVLGGQPFTRAAVRDAQGWKLRPHSVRFTRALMINDYQETPGSGGHTFLANPDLGVEVPQFTWKRAFSPIIRLSTKDLYPRQGSAGHIDARLDTLAWGARNGIKYAAPLIAVDRLRSTFAGGRWVFLAAELADDFFASDSAKRLGPVLEQYALRGSEDFLVRPTLPLYLPGEQAELNITWNAPAAAPDGYSLEISLLRDGQPAAKLPPTALPLAAPVRFPLGEPGRFTTIEARLLQNGELRRVYRSGFWIRDLKLLNSGPRLTVNRDYFELDGKPMAIVGTTYMSSEVQRQFFLQPNAYVWDADMAHISAAGLNMIRTGWWSAWDKVADPTGAPTEDALRALEAYLMSARRHNLPVQFTFFSFLPEVLGGENPYLDPAAQARQRALVAGVTARFNDVPWLVWDWVNEPSYSKHLWRTRPNGDSFELKAWNDWLAKRYPDRTDLARAWNLTAAPDGPLPLPTEAEFEPRGMYVGKNSLKLYDFYLFSQQVFLDWAEMLRRTARQNGANQLITVGQDEGGGEGRIPPYFYAPAVDFTTTHSWWQNDHLLWDSLIAKVWGKPMLVQETGLQRELEMDEHKRRTAENEGRLFERKMALAWVQGAGAIEWLWNINAYMSEDNEVPIGAVRVDGTEKPEATVLRDFARFARDLAPHLRAPEQPQVAIVTSQALQFSIANPWAMEAQRKSVRALHYINRVPAYLVTENRIAELGKPRLAILPSPQALAQTTWERLLKYAEEGGTLLITGPAERDPQWHRAPRAASVGLNAVLEPVTYRHASMRAGSRTLDLAFPQDKQFGLEALRFPNSDAIAEVKHGRGRILWAPYAVELAEGDDNIAAVYEHALQFAGLQSRDEKTSANATGFRLDKPLAPGVLVHRTALAGANLYVITNETAAGVPLAFTDSQSKARLRLTLPSQRAALVLVRRSDGKVLARYAPWE